MRSLFFLAVALCWIPGAVAQEQPSRGSDEPPHDPYLTRSGATVDKPGEPQGSAPTPLDRDIRRQDDRIDGSLCKGC